MKGAWGALGPLLWVALLGASIVLYVYALTWLGSLLLLIASVALSLGAVGGRQTLRGIVASVPAGLLVGVGLREMMRSVAITSDISPVFTIGGTVSIVIDGLPPAVVLGLGYVFFRRLLPGRWYGKAATYGLVLALALGLPLMFSAPELHLARVIAVPIAFFIGLPFLYSLLLEYVLRSLEREGAAVRSQRAA